MSISLNESHIKEKIFCLHIAWGKKFFFWPHQPGEGWGKKGFMYLARKRGHNIFVKPGAVYPNIQKN